MFLTHRKALIVRVAFFFSRDRTLVYTHRLFDEGDVFLYTREYTYCECGMFWVYPSKLNSRTVYTHTIRLFDELDVFFLHARIHLL